MQHNISLYTGQWVDMELEQVCQIAQSIGFTQLELASQGKHIELDRADDTYCYYKRELLNRYGLQPSAVSAHLVGQCVADRIDERHRSIVPDFVWGDGHPDGVRYRATQAVIAAAYAAKRLGVNTVVGFTGSPIWHMFYAFPPAQPYMIDSGFAEFANRWRPILDEYQSLGIRFALEVHPAQIAFDTASAERALQALDYHPAFGFNFDPSHFAYQGVDYIDFIRKFADRIFHTHMKDVWWSDTPKQAGVFGGHTSWGDPRRYWDFCSVGRGKVDFNAILTELNNIAYTGALSVEWEDCRMNREQGAAESFNHLVNLLSKLKESRSKN